MITERDGLRVRVEELERAVGTAKTDARVDSAALRLAVTQHLGVSNDQPAVEVVRAVAAVVSFRAAIAAIAGYPEGSADAHLVNEVRRWHDELCEARDKAQTLADGLPGGPYPVGSLEENLTRIAYASADLINALSREEERARRWQKRARDLGGKAPRRSSRGGSASADKRPAVPGKRRPHPRR